MTIRIAFSDWRPAIRPLAPGQAAAAVGDVHGQDDLFGALLNALADDLASRSAAPVIVQLGDLVDRGTGSIDALRRAQRGLPGISFVTLMGNHEDCLLRALGDDEDDALRWFNCGGATTLAQLGLSPDDTDWRERLRSGVGDETLDWVARLPTAHRIGDLLFVHAGIDPETPLVAQDATTMMWVRGPFLDSDGPYPEGVAVIHGHTPQKKVELRHPHRVNLDTGAFRSGVLSALMIAGDRMRLAQAVR
ncbi:metallophosphoesterase [Hansschlegelia quercus]|uniref:Serine/threonine protein phosphatase n=1 Tax=Hansschlegelia quercus TaxID=2528245 RepID=A0A4Q9GHU2_9HYPH|nr:metallophosphoesterase [Hansschlegelia quercus]TBN48246.1 serine/threonine protein phosphatase [Hansschlegelia quercus]